MSTERLTPDDFVKAVRFDAQGLVAAVAQDAKDGRVLMVAWMNAETLRQTLSSGDVTYWSRSRNEVWRKGATSGHTQRLIEAWHDTAHGAMVNVAVAPTPPAPRAANRAR